MITQGKVSNKIMMAYYHTAPTHTAEDSVLIFILIIIALVMKLIFKKFFPNVSSLKEVVITAVILLAVIVIYLIFVTS